MEIWGETLSASEIEAGSAVSSVPAPASLPLILGGMSVLRGCAGKGEVRRKPRTAEDPGEGIAGVFFVRGVRPDSRAPRRVRGLRAPGATGRPKIGRH